MASTTENYYFRKPSLSDSADITAFNDNFDRIDTLFTRVNENLNNMQLHVEAVGIRYVYKWEDVDGWECRKWTTGKIELWKQIPLKITTTKDPTGAFYACTINDAIVFPEDLLTNTPMIQVTTIGGGYPCAIVSYPNRANADLLIKTEWAVTEQEIYINVYAIGEHIIGT